MQACLTFAFQNDRNAAAAAYLAETRTEQFCEEITVPKEIVATLLLAAGGKGGVSVGGGGGGSSDDLTNWDGTKKKDRGRRR